MTKKILLILVLLVPTVVQAQRWHIVKATVAELVAIVPTVDRPYLVTDGAFPDDCDTGSGSYYVWCVHDGSSWQGAPATLSTETRAGNPNLGNKYVILTDADSLGGILFEGNNQDAFESLLTVEEPTSDKIWTLPDESGTLITTVSTDVIEEAHLNAVAGPTDEFCLTYEVDTTNFAWQACSAGAGDVSDVGDCTSGACFNGTTGTTLTFETAGASDITLDAASSAGGNTLTLPDETGTILSTVSTDVIGTAQVIDNEISEPDLKVVDSPADEECLTYEGIGGDFEWQACGGVEVNDLETTDPPNVLDTEIYIGTGVGTGAWAVVSGDATLANTGALSLVNDSVGPNELDANAVAGELEAVMDLSSMQGSVTDGQVPDTITVSNYLALTGGTMTGQITTDNLGIEFGDSDTNPTCGAGNYNIFADLSETTLKKCINGVASDLDTTAAEVNNLETTDPPNVLDTEIYIGTGAGTGAWSVLSGDATLANNGVVTIAANAVALTTDTSGNYVASITNGTGITGGDGGSEGAALTLATTLGTAIDAGEVTAAAIDGDDVNSNIAGRSLTLTAASPDTLDADAELYTSTKCMVIETPADADNFLFWRTDLAITVTGIDCLVNAATSAVTTVQECDANGGTCTAVEAAMTCGTTNTTEAAGIDNAAIDAGDWLRLDVGTVTGTPGHVNVCVTYTKDD
jgi:hypothetical protein